MVRTIVFLLALILFPSVSNAQFTITLNAASGMSQESIDGFRQAADYWESVLADPVNLNLDIDFRRLGNGILGSTGSTRQTELVSDYFAGLALDITSSDDVLAVAGLPGLSGGALSFQTQVNTEGGSNVVSFDNDGSVNNRVLALNTANAKSLGLFTGDADAADGNIVFSDRFNWDFDQSDGVGSGLQDFVGVAVHEIGHALGFVSGVDAVSSAIDDNVDLENSVIFSGLDMFRYSSDDGFLDLAVGTDSYFSLDGGTTNLGLFSTGIGNGGDGRQASHWKDNMNLGIMDPTARPAGQINLVTELDLMAFDVIGYDLVVFAVPEPASALVVCLMFGCGALRRRRTGSTAFNGH